MPRKAFTLIELLVVISIISLLASVVLAALNSARDKGRMSAGKQFAANVDHAAGDEAAGLWDFNDCTGLIAADSSGNGRAGILNSMATTSWVSDTPLGYGCSLTFNGSSQYISAGHVQDGTVPFTWTAWIKGTQIATHASAWGYPAIIGTIQASGATNDAMLMVNNGYLAWYDELNSGGVALTTGAFVSDGFWHHVAASRSGSTIRFFVDGRIVGSVTTGNNPINSNGLEIARAIWSDSKLFGGNIDQVHVFSKDLTASEISRLYASERVSSKFADKVE